VRRRREDVEQQDQCGEPDDRDHDHRDLAVAFHGSHLNLKKISQTKKL
jgi:hypothetical protein